MLSKLGESELGRLDIPGASSDREIFLTSESFLQCASPLVAEMQSADFIGQCLSSRAKRKTFARTEFFSAWQFEPCQ